MIKTVKLASYELRRFKGPLPIVALLFLLLVPTLYGALYLWSNWDPYGKLDQVPVAVVNQDVPVEVERQDRRRRQSAGRRAAGRPDLRLAVRRRAPGRRRAGRRRVLHDDHHPAGLLGEPGQRRRR